jgi:hypothetical protein
LAVSQKQSHPILARVAFIVVNSGDETYYSRRLYQELEGVSRGKFGLVNLDEREI